MRLVERYMAKVVLGSIFLVLLMLTGLEGFILSVNQLGDLGKADYGIVQVLVFVMAGIPYQVYLFFPMACLLGCLVGLGTMANHHELVVMRAAGFSMLQMTAAVFKAASILILMVTLMGEFLFPKWVLWANDYKTQALNGDHMLQTKQGLWLHIQDDIVTIGSVASPTRLRQVDQFHFDSQGQLLWVRHMGRLEREGVHWVAYDVDESHLSKERIVVSHASRRLWPMKLDPRMVRMTHNEPDEMTFFELEQFIQAQRQNHQNIQKYQLAYWQRLILPITTLVMILLAMPFIFGPHRSSSIGSKLMIGAVIGFGFYILNQFFGSLSQIYQFSAISAALGPTFVCAVLGIYLMYRVR